MRRPRRAVDLFQVGLEYFHGYSSDFSPKGFNPRYKRWKVDVCSCKRSGLTERIFLWIEGRSGTGCGWPCCFDMPAGSRFYPEFPNFLQIRNNIKVAVLAVPGPGSQPPKISLSVYCKGRPKSVLRSGIDSYKFLDRTLLC